jgi:hypothetical protein
MDYKSTPLRAIQSPFLEELPNLDKKKTSIDVFYEMFFIYTEKEEPQPHVVLALGFLITN